MSKVYTIRLVRPVFQSTVIEVEALSRKSAQQKALRRAKTLNDSDWSAPMFDQDRYEPHVEMIVDNQEVYETSPTPHQAIRAFRSGDNGHVAYLILEANLNDAVGRLLPQPWFRDLSPVLQADVCSDWVDAMAFIVENDGLDEDASWPGCDDDGQDANIIAFPVGEPGDEAVESQS